MNRTAMVMVLRQFSRNFKLLELLRSRTFGAAKRRRVYMSFVRTASGWHCRFHADDLQKSPISTQFVFRNLDKIREAARRGDGLKTRPSRNALDEALSLGRGGMWLHLTARQYSALVSAKRSHPRET